MKTVIRKVVAFFMAIPTLISIGACSALNQKTAADVCAKLEDRYGVKFIATHIGDRLDRDTAKLFVHPEDNSEIVFTVITDPEGNIQEDYVDNLVLYQIETAVQDAFRERGFECAANGALPEDDLDETDTSLTPDAFFKKHSIPAILLHLALNGPGSDAETIVAVLEQASERFGVNMAVKGYVLEGDAFAGCREDFVTYPTCTDDQIRKYSPSAVFSTMFRKGTCDITVEELRAKLEG